MKRLCILLVLIFACLTPHQTAKAESYANYAINYWCSYYKVSCWQMHSIAQCESGTNPNAYNSWSGASGLFQWLPSSFWYVQNKMNADPYDTSYIDHRSYWNAGGAAHAAAYWIAHGHAYEWTCSYGA